MKKEKVCKGHIPSFFMGSPEYEIVSKKECKWCIHNQKIKDKK